MEARDEKPQYGVVRVDAAGRRWYTQRFKNEIVALCRRPGASVSKVSIEHGLNTNLMRKWLGRVHEEGLYDAAALMPVVVDASQPVPGSSSSSAVIEIRVGKAVIAIAASASSEQIEAVVRALR